MKHAVLLVFAGSTLLAFAAATQAADAPSATEIYDARIAGRQVLTPKHGPAPCLNGPVVYGCRPNRQFVYRIPCTGQRPIEFGVEGLPASLKLDAKNGILSGMSPAEKGNYRLALHATSAHGKAQRELTIVVGDTLALTPPMGWNHWHIFYHFVTDAKIRAAGDAMVANGMADVGYQYVCIDDCWMRIAPEQVAGATDRRRKTASKGLRVEAVVGQVRDEKGRILPNGNFPDMKALTDHLHAMGLKAGIYSSPGPRTCQRFEGSYQHEAIDARTYAEWGFDFLKYDWCSYREIAKDKGVEEARRPYQIMGDALQKVDRDIVFSLCQYGIADVWKWGQNVHGNLWRTSGDLAHTINRDGLYRVARETLAIGTFAGPGHWNDPDFLQLGMWVSPFAKADPPRPIMLSPNEQYSYMSLWCLMAAPLIFSGDMTRLDEFTWNVLCNPEVIAVNQDRLGKAARVVRMTDSEWVLAKPMADGSLTFGLLSLDKAADREISVGWSELGIAGLQRDTRLRVRDLWRQKDIGAHGEKLTVRVGPRGVCLVNVARE